MTNIYSFPLKVSHPLSYLNAFFQSSLILSCIDILAIDFDAKLTGLVRFNLSIDNKAFPIIHSYPIAKHQTIYLAQNSIADGLIGSPDSLPGDINNKNKHFKHNQGKSAFIFYRIVDKMNNYLSKQPSSGGAATVTPFNNASSETGTPGYQTVECILKAKNVVELQVWLQYLLNIYQSYVLLPNRHLAMPGAPGGATGSTALG